MYAALMLYGPVSQPVPLRCIVTISQSYNPAHAVTCPVWALPLSLATTQGITIVFFSSAYLDVSVQRVGLLIAQDDTSSTYQVVPFGNPGM